MQGDVLSREERIEKRKKSWRDGEGKADGCHPLQG